MLLNLWKQKQAVEGTAMPTANDRETAVAAGLVWAGAYGTESCAPKVNLRFNPTTAQAELRVHPSNTTTISSASSAAGTTSVVQQGETLLVVPLNKCLSCGDATGNIAVAVLSALDGTAVGDWTDDDAVSELAPPSCTSHDHTSSSRRQRMCGAMSSSSRTRLLSRTIGLLLLRVAVLIQPLA
jgi:hypothetical protein